MKYKQKRNEKKRGKDGGVALSTDIISFPFDSLSLSLSLYKFFFLVGGINFVIEESALCWGRYLSFSFMLLMC